MLECANGCNQVVCHLQAVADLIKANGFAATYHWCYMEEVFLMKKDKDFSLLRKVKHFT